VSTDHRPRAATPPARRAPTGSPATRRPLHVAVAFGASTSLYAIALLGVTRIQIETDLGRIAEREPAAAAIDLLARHHDQMTTQLDGARDAYASGVAHYSELADLLAGLAADIGRLDETVSIVEAGLRGIPGTFNIPVLPPRTSGGGSGGSGTSGGTSSGGSVTLPPPPVAATPPPTQGTTGSSGTP
jgi:hypothetical protein